MRNLLVTGGAGLNGSNVVEYMLPQHPGYRGIAYDKLAERGRLEKLAPCRGLPDFDLVQGDICDMDAGRDAIRAFDIDTIVNFAAETHVDRSILDPDAFVRTDVYGAYVLCEVAKSLGLERLHHVATDEVYGPIPRG